MRLRDLLLLTGACIAGCGGPSWPDTPVHVPASCPLDTESPVPDGRGGRTCVLVGAQVQPTGRDVPDVAGLPEPVVHVAVDGSDADGDGSLERPFATLARALDAAPATVALGRGVHAIAGTVEPTAAVVVVGAGAGDTSIEGADPALRATVDVTLRALTVRGGVASSGAALVVEDVAIDGADRGIDAVGGTLTASRVTVDRGATASVRIAAGASATIDRLLARDGERYGVVVTDARIHLTDALVTRHERDGVAILGGVDGDADGSPDPHVVTRTASLANGVTALRVEGVMARAELSLLTLSGTRVPAGTHGGDGLYVAGGASASLDASIASDTALGHGSELVGNARAGALVAGAGTTADLSGALVGSNHGPGIFLQTGAIASRLGYSRVEDNLALGVGVASGARAIGVPCNTIQATREGTLSTATSGDLVLGDGLSITEGGVDPSEVIGNRFVDNERFGVVIAGAGVRMRDNTGSGNRYGVGTYGAGERDIDASNAIDGDEPPPAAATTARGEIAVGAVTGP